MDTPTIRVNGKTLLLHTTSGVVTDNQKASETEVHGRGSSSHAYGRGSGSMEITSTTNRHQTIFLREEDGLEHEISHTNFEIPCRTGHAITAVLPVRKGRKQSYYTHFYNHATDTLIENKDALKSVVGRPVLSALALWLVAMFAGLMLGASTGYDPNTDGGGPLWIGLLVVLLGPIAYYWLNLRGRVKAFKESRAFADLVAGFAPA